MKVLGIGELVLDKIHQLDAYPEEGSKASAQAGGLSVGGPVAAGLIVLSRLGADCTMIASLGNDHEAEYIKMVLAKENIKLIKKSRKQTKINHVLINQQSGSRTIIKEPQPIELIKNVKQAHIVNTDSVLFDRHEPRAFAQVMNQKKRSTLAIIDPSTEVSKKTLKMCRLAEFPILPQESLEKMPLSKLYQNSGKPMVITRGEDGCSIYDGRKETHINPYKVKAIDTLGAGDVFRGAFAYGLMQKWDLEQCCQLGNCVAALQCTRIGNGTAIPTQEEIWDFYHQNYNNKC